MDNCVSKSSRIKFANVFSESDIGKNFKISFWVYIPKSDGDYAIKEGCYGTVGTSYQASAYDSGSPSQKVTTGQWQYFEYLYCHDDSEVTQIGIDQLGSTDLAPTIYFDDIKVVRLDSYLDEYGFRRVPVSTLTPDKDMYNLRYYADTRGNRMTYEELKANYTPKSTLLFPVDLLSKRLNSTYAKTAKVAVSDNDNFTNALRVTVTNDPPLEYSDSMTFKPSTDYYTAGDACLWKFYARGISSDDESGMCAVSLICENNDSMHTKCLNEVIYFPADGTWHEVLVPFNIKYPSLNVRVTHYNQVFELGGFEVFNYEGIVSADRLPSVVNDEEAVSELLDANAKWRSDAIARIEQIRKGNVRIIVKDKNGNLVKNAKVTAQMKEHEFKFGSAVSTLVNSGGNTRKAQYRKEFSSLFNTAVSESNHKWKYYNGNEETAKKLTDTVLNKLGARYYRGHVLCTDADSEDIDMTLPTQSSTDGEKEEYRNKVTEYRNTVFSKLIGDFKGQISEWDVLNEATAVHKMKDIYGVDIYKQWYDIARKYAGSDVSLFYNEARIFDENFYSLLDEMTAANVDFQGIGLESHLGLRRPTKFEEVLKKVSSYGKRIMITEYDESIKNPELEASFMRDILILSFSYENVDGFLMWGFNDSSHWKGNAPIYYEDWTLKESGRQYIDLVYNKWWTRESGSTNALGRFDFRGFYGDYVIKCESNGKTVNKVVKISKDTDNVIEITLN